MNGSMISRYEAQIKRYEQQREEAMRQDPL